jgi:hypothetical protein
MGETTDMARLAKKVDMLLDDAETLSTSPPAPMDFADVLSPMVWEEKRALDASTTDWNSDITNAPNEIFHEIFKRLPYQVMISMRAVCLRFRAIINDPHTALRRFSLTTIDASKGMEDDIEWSDDLCFDDAPAPPPPLPFSLFARDAGSGRRQVNFDIIEDNGFFAHSGSKDVPPLTFRLSDPLSLGVLSIVQQRPHWFVSASYVRQSNIYLVFSFDVNLSTVEKDCIEAPSVHFDLARRLLSKTHRTRDVSIHSVLGAMLSSDLPFISHECESTHILPDRLDLLNGAQRSLVGWLQRMERQVLSASPLAVLPLIERSNKLAGTVFAFDIFGDTDSGDLIMTNRTPPNVTLALDARGVIVADEPGLSKTRAIAEFLLGSDASRDVSHITALVDRGDAATSAGSVPHDRLLFTHAYDFGTWMCTGDDGGLNYGLLLTHASLVIASNTTVSTWMREVQLLFPRKRILFVTNKREHEKLTYASVASADMVIVTKNFLTNWAYYPKLRWSKLFTGERRAVLTEVITDSAARHVLEKLEEKMGRGDFPHATAPLLEWFAWPNVVVDEIHEYHELGGKNLLRQAGIQYLSARFAIGVSATPTRPFNAKWFMYNHLAHWLRLGYRCEKLKTLSVRRSLRYQKGPHYLRHAHDAATWSGNIYTLGSLCDGDLQWHVSSTRLLTAREGRLQRALATGTVLALFHRNTRVNVERFHRIPPAKYVNIVVQPHPLITLLVHLVTALGGDADDADLLYDFPIPLATLLAQDETKRNKGLAGSYWNIWLQLVAHVEAFVARFEQVAESAERVNPCTTLNPTSFITNKLRVIGLRETFAKLPEKLARLAMRHSLSDILEPIENAFGSRATVLISLLRDIFTHEPAASVIVASVHRSAMSDLLKKHAGMPFTTLGGLNGRTSMLNEKAFVTGQVKLLNLDSSQAASGLNLQCASTLILYDHEGCADEIQLEGRVRRPGAAAPPTIIRLKTAVATS